MRIGLIWPAILLVGCSASPPADGPRNGAATPEAEAVSNGAAAAVDNSVSIPVSAPAPKVRQGRCGMEECSYSQELRREVIGGGATGQLLRLSLRGGTSSRAGSAITWAKSPHDVYVYCSTTLPSVMLQTGGGWQVDVLDFVIGVPGALESSQDIYISACHADDSRFPADAGELGYGALSDEAQEISVNAPRDIFALAERFEEDRD